MRSLSTSAIVCALTFLVAACVSYQADNHHPYSEYQHVEPGVTTSAWLENNFGQPDHIEQTSAGTQVWQYEEQRREKTDVSLFILFDFSSVSTVSNSYFFELQDDVVLKSWRVD